MATNKLRQLCKVTDGVLISDVANKVQKNKHSGNNDFSNENHWK